MLLPLLRELAILSVAFDKALAAPSQTDRVYGQQGRSESHNGHLFRRDDAADLRHSRFSSLPITAASSASYITLVTPSPGASAISITSQGQIITSYSALTVCPTPTSSSKPIALSFSSSAVSVGISSGPVISPSARSNTTYGFARRQVSGPYANITTIPALYANTTNTSAPSVPESPVTSCSVTYIPTTMAICHTIITPLGGIQVPVSACDQNITFSSDHDIASTASSTELLTIFYVAAWQDVVKGVPTGTVQKEMCNSASQCSTVQEKWSITTATITQTQTNTLSVDTVVTGPALVILPPSSTLTLTDSTPSTISTSLVYEVFPTTTSLEIVKQTLSGVTTPTQTGAVVPSTTITRTSTSTMTVTLQGMTLTSTI